MASMIDGVIHLSPDYATRLRELAQERGASEDALIEQALDLLFSQSQDTPAEEGQLWQVLSLGSLQKVWDNDADAVYDDWRGLYGVPEG